MLRREDCRYLLYGGGGEGGEAVKGAVPGCRPGHGHLALVVEHLVAGRGTGEERQADLLAKHSSGEVERRLEASEDLDRVCQ